MLDMSEARAGSSMATASHDQSAVQPALDLLASLSVLSAVTLSHHRSAGTVFITVRKTGSPSGQRSPYRYQWVAQATAGGQRWDDTGVQAYPTAGAAYQAAAQTVQTANWWSTGE